MNNSSEFDSRDPFVSIDSEIDRFAMDFGLKVIRGSKEYFVRLLRLSNGNQIQIGEPDAQGGIKLFFDEGQTTSTLLADKNNLYWLLETAYRRSQKA